jgi:glucose-1-phosphate cytidylyltransferase
MEVVILCGGQGTRIRDVADDIPKPMIPIGNRPIVWHIMKGYAQHGFTDFILCLGYQSWNIKRFFLDYHLAQTDFTVDLGDRSRIDVQGPTCGENWRGDTFLLTYGDGVADVDVETLIHFHRRHGKLGTVTAVRAPGRFGEIELDGSQVVEFLEKPLVAKGRINGGFFVFNRGIFERLDNNPKLIFENEPLASLANEGQLMAYAHDGFWHPMDNSRDYHYLNDLWARGQAPWNTWEPQRVRIAA